MEDQKTTESQPQVGSDGLLAACPLCGADGECSQEYDHTPDGPRVQCVCGLAAPYGHDMDDACDEWNALAARVAANPQDEGADK